MLHWFIIASIVLTLTMLHSPPSATEIVLCIIGGQFTGIPDGEVCGAVLSVRYNEDILALWNRSANERELVERIRDSIKKVLQLPPYANMEYKPHQNSMADRSSFRNTHVWKPKSLGERAISHGPEPRRQGSWGERVEGMPSAPAAVKPKRDTSRGWR
jgi:Eukaryotic initiation factor 4E